MNIRLSHILDLDYYAGRDNARTSPEEILALSSRDREIFEAVKDLCSSEQDLLLAWLAAQKKENPDTQDHGQKDHAPGRVYERLYYFMTVFMILSGLGAGLSLAGSFLVYHGSRPVNVAVLVVVFALLPLFLGLVSLIAAGLRSARKTSSDGRSLLQMVHTLVFYLVFECLPVVLKKMNRIFPGGAFDRLSETAGLVKSKTRAYQALFFWPFLILTALFSISFSFGGLIALIFKVLVSDMAFGWQSTLITSAEAVHNLISAMAYPWQFFVSGSAAHPDLEQIEGSRIILKQGISVLAAEDLASWWPFISLSIFFYGMLPRLAAILLANAVQKRVLNQFAPARPEFRAILLRMTAPALDIRSPEPGTDPGKILEPDPGPTADKRPQTFEKTAVTDSHALVLASDRVYSNAAIQKITDGLHQAYGVIVNSLAPFYINTPDFDDPLFADITDDTDPVILVMEAWQPPIRGLLFSIKELRSRLPEQLSLWILLTAEAGRDDLSLLQTDEHLKVWQAAVQTLEHPGIIVKQAVAA